VREQINLNRNETDGSELIMLTSWKDQTEEDEGKVVKHTAFPKIEPFMGQFGKIW